MRKGLGRCRGRKQRSSLLTTSVLEPWLSPSPPVGLHEGDVDSGRQGGSFKEPPRPAFDELLEVAVPCFKRRSMADIVSL